ncbi:hypothetical protein KGM48_03430 [Patescibacteria group bacterium]|nr:hypothetical protein [Patescibacteria group bacterium]
MENAFRKIITRHAAALALALMVGALYAGPDVYHAFTPGYRGVPMMNATDEDFYLTVIHKSSTSSGLVQNPFNYEYRAQGNPFQYFFIEYALGHLGSFFHLGLDQLVIMMELVFPALLTLLTYAFGYWLSRSRLTGLLVAAALLLGNEIVHPDGLANLANTFLLRGSAHDFLTYMRPINPQESSLFFFGTLFSFALLARHPHKRWWRALTGGLIGVLAYIYLYYWIFAAIALGVFLVDRLVARDWRGLAAYAEAGVWALLSMTPFIITNLSLALHGGTSALTEAIPTHRFIVEKLILFPLGLYLLIALWGRKKRDSWAALFSSKYRVILLFLITSLLVSNHQVLDGRLYYQQHFHFFTNIPILLIALAVLGGELLERFPVKYRVGTAAGVILVCASFCIGVDVSSYRAHANEASRFQALSGVAAYLDKYADPVVIADGTLSTRITALSGAYAYGAGGTDATFGVPFERIRNNYFVSLRLEGITPATLRPYLDAHRDEASAALFIATYWRDFCGSYGCFPDSVLDALVAAYRDFYASPFRDEINRARADFVLWDTVSDPAWGASPLLKSAPVYQNGDFKVYALHAPS